MFGSRKRSLTIALTVVSLLAMLAPAAMAAPQWVHGVAITSPTTADPAYLEGDPGDSFTIAYTVAVVGLQVNEAEATFTLFDQNGDVEQWESAELDVPDISAPLNNLTQDFAINVDEGWYDLEVCVSDNDDNTWCDYQAKALLVDGEEPEVDLLKPDADDWRGATFVTGTAFLLVGTAWDRFGVKSAQFEYCIEGRECRWSDDWVKIADAVPTPGIWGQWQATWDSTQVPDSEKRFGMIRMCAFDLVGNTNCEFDRSDTTVDAEGVNHFNPWDDAHWVFVNNRHEIDLVPGWNLISLPLVPYNSAIGNVLFHLIQHGSVKSVWAYFGPVTGWKSWTPSGPSSLTTMVDGQGYWIEMATEDELTVVGTWSWAPNAPPQYSVLSGWNQIGYTHWGRPTIFPPKTSGDYLGPTVTPQALYLYDAPVGVFRAVYPPQHMTLGAGFWLASAGAASYVP